jgi:outer membrane protein assembly factor BamD (BamD/ComL family)
LVAQWPEHDHAWKAQVLIAKMHKRRMRAAPASTSEARTALNAALRDLVARYPSSPAAPGARQWLDRHGHDEEGGRQ